MISLSAILFWDADDPQKNMPITDRQKYEAHISISNRLAEMFNIVARSSAEPKETDDVNPLTEVRLEVSESSKNFERLPTKLSECGSVPHLSERIAE